MNAVGARLLGATLVATVGCAPSTPGGRFERVDRVFANLDRTDSPGCAVGIIRDGELVYSRGYGMASLELGVPISSRTVFYVGSVSKQFVLAEIVKRATGQPLREFARENIFGPLGMTHTRFHDDRTEVVPGRALAYESDDDGGFRLLWYLNFDKVGSGGLLTTVEDLLLWDRFFYADSLAEGGLVERLLERGVLNDGTELSYAFGLLHGTHRGLRTLDHAGSFMGFRAQLLRFPDERVSVVALCNLASADPDRRTREVADVVLEDRFTEPATPSPGEGDAIATRSAVERTEPTDAMLRGCEGHCFSEELQATYVIARDDGGLTLQRGRFEAVALEPTAPGELRVEDLRLVFERADGGRAAALTVHAGRVRDIRFERIVE